MNDRILVVDDEQTWQAIFAQILNVRGRVVDATQTVEAARRMLRQNRYAALVLDLILSEPYQEHVPVESQLFLLHVKEEYPNLPVIATTGKLLSPADIFRLHDLGVREFLDKLKMDVNEARSRIDGVIRAAG